MIRHELIARLELEAGGVLPEAHIVYHTSQETWDGRRPVIWICHALTANSDPEDWWPEMVGPGKAIDTERNFVACVNMLGSAYGSEGPARVNPATGKRWLLDFPKVTVRDMVASSILVRKELGINSVDLIVGSSIGGFQAIEWAITEPDLFRRCVFIATAPRISPYASATVEAQRMALEADPTFREAKDLSGGAAEKLVRRNFDAYSYYTICNALDSQNVGRGRGGVAAALSRIKACTTVVAIDSDNLFPVVESRAWAPLIPGAEYMEISSRFGHDGFLLETARLTAILMK